MHKILNYFFQLIFSILNQDSKKYIFTSSPDFSDNSFAFFIYLDQNHEFTPVWLLNNAEQINEYKDIAENYGTRNDIVFIRKNSLQGIYHYLTANFVFSTHGIFRKFGKIKGHKTINLWHGMPIKNIENYDKNNKSDPDSSNIYIVTSKFYKEKFYKIFNVEQSSVLVTGLPRNDFLINGTADIVKALKIKLKVTKVIMWMPTFRESNNKLNPIFSIENISLLNSFLEKSNSFCAIKLHPQDNTDLTFIDTFDRIKVIDDRIFKKNYLYEFFNSVDILLTDFSSIYVDFLLLNKPIGFFTPDIKSYSDRRGFLFKNIEDIMPGEVLKDMNEVVHFLENIIVKNKDVNIFKREKVKDLFHDIEKNFSKQLESEIL